MMDDGVAGGETRLSCAAVTVLGRSRVQVATCLGQLSIPTSRSRMPLPAQTRFLYFSHYVRRRAPQEVPCQTREHPLAPPEQPSWVTSQGQSVHHNRRWFLEGYRVRAMTPFCHIQLG